MWNKHASFITFLMKKQNIQNIQYTIYNIQYTIYKKNIYKYIYIYIYLYIFFLYIVYCILYIVYCIFCIFCFFIKKVMKDACLFHIKGTTSLLICYPWESLFIQTFSYTGLCVVPSTSITGNSSISNFLNVCRLSPELLFLESVESCRKKICRL